uniref:Uncharacterized protein n=1 Tax=Favella ehrenbergii TaxID=182087 RepID=A0A7S3MLR3_9SPIT|mmetsp:Transcript_46449/g.61521  ORF Transcript_46449/g.61521 Transcript_46449/m.61521 type:complete len:224 (-) Transcript_46449:780-1451(-)
MLVATAASARNRINLIEENSRWPIEPSHFKKDAHKFLTLASPLRGKARNRHVEESSLSLGCDRLRKHGLARAWWAKHANTLPRAPDTLEVVGHEDREEDGLLQKLLSVVKICDVVEHNIRALIDDLSLKHINQISVGADTVWVVVFHESLRGRFLLVRRRLQPRLVVVAASFAPGSTTAFIGGARARLCCRLAGVARVGWSLALRGRRLASGCARVVPPAARL